MLTTQREVEEAIELCQFTKSQNPNLVTAREIARAVLPQLSEELKEAWILERLMRITKRKRETDWRDDGEPKTLTLPGMESLPRRIFLRNGRRAKLDRATINQVREALEMLRQRALESPKILLMEMVLELMEKYTPKFPRITWGKVKELELQARTDASH